MSRTKLLISSDITIPFASLSRLQYVYGQGFIDNYVDGLEVIALGGMWNLQRQLTEAAKLDMSVLSIHGAMGQEKINVTVLDHIKGVFFDSMVHLDELIPAYGSDIEILGHTPIFKERRTLEAINKFTKKNVVTNFQIGGKTDFSATPSISSGCGRNDNGRGLTQLWMENHPTQLSGFDATVGLTKNLRTQGVPVGIVIDIAHLLRELQTSLYSNKSFVELWPVAMEMIEKLLLRQKTSLSPIPVGFHLPIGSFLEDAVPREILLDSGEDAFGWFIRVCKEYEVTHIVIENQHTISKFGWTTEWQVDFVRDWTQPVIQMLVSQGVVLEKA